MNEEQTENLENFRKKKLEESKKFFLTRAINYLFFDKNYYFEGFKLEKFFDRINYHIFYKHTKKHKEDLRRTRENVLEIRKKAIGR